MYDALVTLSQYNTYGTTDNSAAGGIFAVIAIFYVIFFAIFLVCWALYAMSLYNLVMYDAQYFDNGESDKQLWFWLLLFLAPTSLYYFFAVRPRVRQRKMAAYQQYYNNQNNGTNMNQGGGYSQPQNTQAPTSYGSNQQ